jgi:hypothetical protein
MTDRGDNGGDDGVAERAEEAAFSAEDELLDRLADAFLRGMTPYNGPLGQRFGVTAQMLVEAAATAMAELAYAGEVEEEILDVILCGVAEAVAAAREADRAEELARVAGDMQRAGACAGQHAGPRGGDISELSTMPDLSKMEVKGHA